MLTPHVRSEKHFDETELFDNLKSNLAPFGGSAGWIRDNMTRDDWVSYRPLVAALQPGPWYVGRIVLVGDSVHATSPHLASGAGIAVESAIVRRFARTNWRNDRRRATQASGRILTRAEIARKTAISAY
jgi:2-polyprenyl-6-methoxyphenol hydroxylase-like FAD-dependent oxidoreductase